MKQIQILGPGCAKCKQLAAAAETAANESGRPCTLTKVTDIAQIMAFGIMATPALVIDGHLKSVGRILTPAEIKPLLV